MRKHKKPKPNKRYNVLIVGEGPTEQAFLHHLKDIYHERGCGIIHIMDANGGSPRHIVEYAIKHCPGNEEKWIWMDTDKPWDWPKTVADKCKRLKIKFIKSTPCCEGLLLRIIDQKVQGKSSAKCKRLLKKQIGDKLTDRSNYKKQFTQSQLEKKRSTIPELDQLIRCMSPRETSA